ncbi:hypothetical protein D3C73_955240 [compost metagenome]
MLTVEQNGRQDQQVRDALLVDTPRLTIGELVIRMTVDEDEVLPEHMLPVQQHRVDQVIFVLVIEHELEDVVGEGCHEVGDRHEHPRVDVLEHLAVDVVTRPSVNQHRLVLGHRDAFHSQVGADQVEVFVKGHEGRDVGVLEPRELVLDHNGGVARRVRAFGEDTRDMDAMTHQRAGTLDRSMEVHRFRHGVDGDVQFRPEVDTGQAAQFFEGKRALSVVHGNPF